MIEQELLYRLAVALGIGLLIGLQREYAFSQKSLQKKQKAFSAGARTYPLFALVGWLAAYLLQEMETPLPAVILLAGAIGLIVTAYSVTSRTGSVGITSETSSIVTVGIGMLAFWGELLLSTTIGVTVMLLLSLKLEFQQITRRITAEDVVATLKFAVISAIILPILPTTPLGPPPFDVVNLQKVWLMAVFISGIGFAGYVLIKIVGTEQGISLSGFLGGLVSSTAVTLTFSQRSRRERDLSAPFAIAIIASWTVMFVRVLVELTVINPGLLRSTWLPMSLTGLAGLVYGVFVWRRAKSDQTHDVTMNNPFELGLAIQFAILYGIILVAANGAQQYFGDTGVYLSSVLSGLVDMHAITLSMAQLSLPGGPLSEPVAARAIVLAAVSNTLVKSGIVLFSGAPPLRRALLPGVILIVVVAVSSAFVLI